MINVDEKDIDKLTESVYKILQGEPPPLIILSENFPENEIKQFVKYFNKLLSEYDEFQNIAFSISRGELNSNSSKSKLKVVQSIKSVQSNLRHLTWKTQKIANGDFSQKVDFMGDFSDAFNSMTKQLKEAFDVVKLKNKKLSQQNEEIAAQKDEINEKQVIVNLQNEELHYNNDILLETLEIIRDQKLKIEEAHENIQQSIYYARLIQVAVLPTKKQLREILPKHFILFKPRDIVSGDFFWIRKRDKCVFLAAADCSGHGIPGAFMSMLGVSLLNEIVVDPEIKQANEVLDELRKKMKITLHQNGKDNNSKDGMDIAFCIINTETKELQYSGAFNPLYLFRNGELTEYKGDRQPIGVYYEEVPFENHRIQLQKDDVFYLFSDGYVDQFGGKGERKFLTKRFKNLLYSVQDKNMQEQKEILENAFLNWQGKNDQVDDVLVMGVRV